MTAGPTPSHPIRCIAVLPLGHLYRPSFVYAPTPEDITDAAANRQRRPALTRQKADALARELANELDLPVFLSDHLPRFLQHHPATPDAQATPGPRFCSMPALRDRGWTEAMVRDLLVSPDALVANPRSRQAAPMRLYLERRVQDQEWQPTFPARLALAEARRLRGLKVMDGRRASLLESIEALNITVPILPLAQVQAQAIHSYNRHHGENESASPESSPAFLQRITVNFLRHHLTPYEEQLEALYGQPGRAEAYLPLSRKIFQAIQEAYPALAGECQAQYARRVQGT